MWRYTVLFVFLRLQTVKYYCDRDTKNGTSWKIPQEFMPIFHKYRKFNYGFYVIGGQRRKKIVINLDIYKILVVNCVPDSMLNTLHVLSYLILTTFWGKYYYYLHFTDDEIEVSGGQHIPSKWLGQRENLYLFWLYGSDFNTIEPYVYYVFPIHIYLW